LVILTDQAKTDLKQIHSFIKSNSHLYADDYIFSLLETIENLESFPEKGRVVPELGEISIRELISYPYRIIYEIHHDWIAVLGIIHAKRDFMPAFEGRK
jgi:toxin ParE1/3/4